MPNSWSIRRAGPDDIEALTSMRLRFLEEVGYAHEGVEAAIKAYFQRTVASGQFVAWFAQTGDDVIGTSGLVFIEKPPHGNNLTGREAHIMNMYTLPEFRRQGVASALLDAMRQYARDAGVTCMRLHTTVGATRVYHGQGFRADRSEMVLHLDNPS